MTRKKLHERDGVITVISMAPIVLLTTLFLGDQPNKALGILASLIWFQGWQLSGLVKR